MSQGLGGRLEDSREQVNDAIRNTNFLAATRPGLKFPGLLGQAHAL